MIFPCGVFAEPQEVAVFIGYLSWDADFVAVEVVDLLAAFAFLVGPVVYLCVPRTLYIEIGGFILATACYNLLTEYFMLEEEIPSSNYY